MRKSNDNKAPSFGVVLRKKKEWFMNFHAGAENLDMTGTTTNEVFCISRD
jgi:hypothetical protein